MIDPNEVEKRIINIFYIHDGMCFRVENSTDIKTKFCSRNIKNICFCSILCAINNETYIQNGSMEAWITWLFYKSWYLLFSNICLSATCRLIVILNDMLMFDINFCSSIPGFTIRYDQ